MKLSLHAPDRFRRLRLLAGFCAFLTAGAGIGSQAWAVKPGVWEHKTEADFSAATLEEALVTSLGEVRLARATQPVVSLEGDQAILYDLVKISADGPLFLAAGPQGRLLRLDADAEKAKTVAEFSSSQVFALAGSPEGLWVGVSGAQSRLELRSVEDGTVTRTIELEGVRYIWDLLLAGKNLWVATGTEGKVLVIDLAQPQPQPQVALDSKQTNVLCLASDGKGRVFAGTDTDGLVWRIESQAGKFETFVLFDAPEPEIGALLVYEDGTVFAGTADANQARPGRLEQAKAEPTGRPESTPDVREPSLPNVPPKPEPKENPAKAPESKPAPAPAAVPEKPAPAAAEREPGPPTPQQYGKLREEVAQRLEQLRNTGRITLASPSAAPGRPAVRRPSGPIGNTGGRSAPQAGNAIYRINADGFVSTIFRESVMILKLARSGNALLAATGNEGQVFRVDPEAEEVTALVDLEPQQVPALLALSPDGPVLLGTANPAQVLELASHRFSPSGFLESPALDGQQVSLWGKLQLNAQVPEGSSITVQTRSGNVADPESGGWSEWTRPVALRLQGGTSDYVDVLSPPARFLQYRLNLASDGKASPTVLSVALKYLMPNLPPVIREIKAAYEAPKARDPADAATPQPLAQLKVEWTAEDPNQDRLTYRLEARPFDQENAPYLAIAEDLEANQFVWDTRTAPDGRYLLRVTATDRGDNIPEQALSRSRRSDPLVVDNTPPEIQGLEVHQEGKSATLKLQAVDRLSPIAEVRYKIGAEEKWSLVLPEDLIYDSTSENVVVKLSDLPAGPQTVSLRVSDDLGNTVYLARTLNIRP